MGTLKHGAHRLPLDLPALAAGAAADTSTLFTYDFNYAAFESYDYSVESLFRATLTFDSNVAAVATNNFGVSVSHYNSAGTLLNQLTYSNAAAGITATANVPIDLSNGASGNLSITTGGISINGGWTLQPGDSIVVKRFSNGTGQASPAFTVTLAVGVFV